MSGLKIAPTVDEIAARLRGLTGPVLDYEAEDLATEFVSLVVEAERARLREKVSAIQARALARREKETRKSPRFIYEDGAFDGISEVLVLLEPGTEQKEVESTADHDADCECLRCTAGRNAEEARAREEGWGEPAEEPA